MTMCWRESRCGRTTTTTHPPAAVPPGLSARRGHGRRAAWVAAAVAAAAAAVAVPARPASATTGTWNVDASDVWSNSARWTGGIPTAAGDTANLTFNITAT